MGCTNSTQFGTEVALPSATLTSPQPQLIGNGPTIVKPMELVVAISVELIIIMIIIVETEFRGNSNVHGYGRGRQTEDFVVRWVRQYS